jgi:hypothetical protein
MQNTIYSAEDGMSGGLGLLFAALYISEVWYGNWVRTKRLHSKTRALVLFDRVLNQEMRI